MKHLLLFVSAKDCPVCQSFKKNWAELEEQLKNVCHTEMKEVTKKNEQISATFLPLYIRNNVKWFPTFFFLNKSEYDRVASTKDKSGPLNLTVMNTTIRDGKTTHISAVPYTAKDISAWVKSLINPIIPQQVKENNNKVEDQRIFSVQSKGLFVPICNKVARIVPSK